MAITISRPARAFSARRGFFARFSRRIDKVMPQTPRDARKKHQSKMPDRGHNNIRLVRE
jgi:hypothetical protein